MTSSRYIVGVVLVANVLLWRVSTLESQGPYQMNVLGLKDGLRVQTDTTGGQVGSFGGVGEFDIDAPFIVGGRLAVKENGNVGIGIPNPAQKVSVAGIVESTSGGFKFPDGSTLTTASFSGNYVQNTTNPQTANFNVTGNGVVGTNLNVGGNVGIGVPNPPQKLSVAGTVESTSGGFKFPDGTVQDGAIGPVYTTAATNVVGVSYQVGTALLHLTVPNGTFLVHATFQFGCGQAIVGAVATRGTEEGTGVG